METEGKTASKDLYQSGQQSFEGIKSEFIWIIVLHVLEFYDEEDLRKVGDLIKELIVEKHNSSYPSVLHQGIWSKHLAEKINPMLIGKLTEPSGSYIKTALASDFFYKSIGYSRQTAEESTLSQNYYETLREINQKLISLQKELDYVKENNDSLKKIIYSSVASYGSESFQQLIPINMYLDTNDDLEIYKAYQSVLDFLSTIEFETALDFESVKGSWIKQWVSRSKKAMTSSEVIDRLKEAEYAVEVSAILKPQSEVEKNQSEALINIIKSVEGIQNAAIRIGSLIVVKVTNNVGETSVQVRTLSISELHQINKHPELLNQPQQILTALNELVNDQNNNSSDKEPGKNFLN